MAVPDSPVEFSFHCMVTVKGFTAVALKLEGAARAKVPTMASLEAADDPEPLAAITLKWYVVFSAARVQV